MTSAHEEALAVEEEIIECMNPDRPKSFFLFAGAGSGKTRSLVNALAEVCQTYDYRLRLKRQKIAVITYTNAACEEIIHRAKFSDLIFVRTIHSFVWSLIEGLDADIKTWLKKDLETEIVNHRAELAAIKKAGTKKADDLARRIERKTRRLADLPNIKRFVYSPTGDNRERDALNHAEVIKIATDFLLNKPLMQRLLIGKFPFILIDESQDTNKALIEALIHVQNVHSQSFGLGLFGDTMQRIYADGKVDLGRDVPDFWAKPAKTFNHRSPTRIVQLINKIRHPIDQRQQTATAQTLGLARLFVVPATGVDREAIEGQVRSLMAKHSGDDEWNNGSDVKTLILEHSMAARRMNFRDLFDPLYGMESLRTSFLEGTLGFLNFFSNIVLPIARAYNANDKFSIAAVVRKESPLLKKTNLMKSEDQKANLRKARDGVSALTDLIASDKNITFGQVLRCIRDHGLFEIPDALSHHLDTTAPQQPSDHEDEPGGLTQFLSAPFMQIKSYAAYVRGEASFDTHQGVKGREFQRVMVVMDDEESKGFMFKYEKLFGVEPESKTDLDNRRQGKDTAIDRVRRLFYVTCSRSMGSLALVAYSANPAQVRQYAISQGWFAENEIEVLGQ